MFDCYTEHFKSLKGMRTLEWCNNIGVVELELVLGGQVNTFTVTPPRAILIWYFQDQGTVNLVSKMLYKCDCY